MITANISVAFQPEEENAFPAHNKGKLIERYAAEFFHKNDVHTRRVYLPIFWTPYHRQTGFGQGVNELREYVSHIKSEYSGAKFWTVCQYDDGTLLEDPDILVFGAGGNCLTDIPIPLLCDDHPVVPAGNKMYSAAFIGCMTHPLRRAMFDAVNGRAGYFCRMKHAQRWENPRLPFRSGKLFDTLTFRHVMQRSRFALAPRGYGPSSFRLYEAIQMGVVPIYISDRFWLPFENQINWQDFCVMVTPDMVHRIPDIIKRVTLDNYNKMQAMMWHIHRSFFNRDATCQAICRHLENETLS